MSVSRVLNVLNEDLISRFREFLIAFWQHASLKALLAPVTRLDESGTTMEVIEDPAELEVVNPFIPLMLSNSAALVGELILSHPKGRLGVILRPCELSTLVELRKRSWFSLPATWVSNPAKNQEIVTLGVDCSGTFGLAEFTQRLQDLGKEKVLHDAIVSLSGEKSVQTALRIACQLCDHPASYSADITIGFTGIAQEGHLLVIARDDDLDARLGLREATDGMAKDSLILRREAVLAEITEQRIGRWVQRENHETQPTGDLSRFLASITRCSLCADCLDACPLYHGELSSMLGVREELRPKRPQLSGLIEVTRWLASCSGCGMCGEACDNGIPLVPVILNFSRLIREELHYSAGHPREPLPWSSIG